MPFPEFRNISDGFMVTVYSKISESVTDKVTDKVTDNQLKIITEIVKNQTITTSELEEAVGISQRKIKENISKLKEKGILKRIGPSKGGYWQVITFSPQPRPT